MQLFKRISHLNGLNAKVNVNRGRKDGRTEHRTPLSHLAKAGAAKIINMDLQCRPRNPNPPVYR